MANLNSNLFSKKNTSNTIRGLNMQEDLEVLLNECKSNIKGFDARKIRRAFEILYDAQKNSIVINGMPAYTHPLSVALIVARELPLDEESVIAALLHDIWEKDDKYDISLFKMEFGEAVYEIVDGLHKIRDVDIDALNEPAQIENYRKFLIALAGDFRIILIKLADVLENMRNVKYLPEREQIRLARETLEIYTPFANRLGIRNLKWELDDLSFAVLHPKEYAEIDNYLQASYEEREKYIERFIQPLQEKLTKDEFLRRNHINFEITGRAKHIYSIYNKMLLRQKTIDELFDLFAIRIVLDTDDPNMCFYVYGLTASIYPPVCDTFKDYISTPKKNGYQSIHVAVNGLDKRVVEIQIRTRKMHEYSERGVAAHFRYKPGVEKNSILEEDQIQRWLSIVREIFENPENEDSQVLLDEVRANLFADEIYVYTPTNEFITLPVNSTPLDFAYAIHSDIGNHFVAAKVNGKITEIDYHLRNGDQVEIITSNNIKPSEEWLNYVVTSRARNEITKFLKEERKQKKQVGILKWKDALRKYRKHIDDNQLEAFLKSNFTLQEYSTISDFFISIAEDKIDLDSFIVYISEFLPTSPKISKKRSPKYEEVQAPNEYGKFSKSLPDSLNRSVKNQDEEIFQILPSLTIDSKAIQIEFVAKDDILIIKDIESTIMKYNNILITNFDFRLEKSNLYCKIVIESDSEDTLTALTNEIKSIYGIIKIYS
ncbi:MAG: bifunctional (p)ppGpp synthetase/guanosine-3',5'-bis(diphosphate) 3'-pyrophosphohydrolase [Candidatus Kapabacteria bacterium]|nr:bifunctional (p)ppGpp synthetase/guanosine-3',5'-bis(diphosphate) 3'-pyrophosphohydrolase [Candidatus Kapabacteria bacterium]